MPDIFRALLNPQPASYSRNYSRRKQLHSTSLKQPLDRVNVLGDDRSGHTGCVNALSWAKDGDVLLSAGDDTTVRIWRLDPTDTTQEYPFVCDAVIRTGHTSNIFNAQLLPHSSRIATVARDAQVRISDVGDVMDQVVSGREVIYGTRQTRVRVLRCHEDSVKRIITEDSPDLFLTVSEDGSVRQHDLRVHHTCEHGSCPAPLVQMQHSLSSISLSPLTPYQFVVAGESPYGYLFDRRQTGRQLQHEWGMPPDDDHLTTCVRRFGRADFNSNERRGFEHITGTRMASSNGHEVLLSYSSDAVYLYSTLDSPQDQARSPLAVLPPNRRSRTRSPSADTSEDRSPMTGTSVTNDMMEADIDRYLDEEDRQGAIEGGEDDENTTDNEDADDEGDDENDSTTQKFYPNVPLVYPRGRYIGACNVETVKDVNFLGPSDEFVVSGSDDGNLFVWDKLSGKLHDILEGDGAVVNVIEGHPHLPLVAASGIDTTVKLFAPAHEPRKHSRLAQADSIIERNAEASSSRLDLTRLVVYSQLARRLGGDQ